MANDSCVVYVSYATGGASASSPAFRLCKIAANRRMARCVANEAADGVFYEAPTAAGDKVAIADWHHSQSLRVQLGGTVPAAAYGKADAQGRIITDGTTITDNSICKVLEAGVNGDIVQVVPIAKIA